MASQMPPPQGNPSIDKQFLTCRPVLQGRRRTLQTISELSPHHATSPKSEIFSTATGKTNSSDGYTAGAGTSRNNRRRSLPQQGSRLQKVLETQPSIVVTPADAATLRRSLTSPLDWRQGAAYRLENTSNPERNDSNRHSVDKSLQKRYSQDHQAKNGHAPRNSHNQQIPAIDRPHSATQGKRPASQQKGVGRSTSFGIGWNARRERERAHREQAVAEAKARREREGYGIVLGSPSALPSVFPLPSPSPRPGSVRSSAHQQHLLRRARCGPDTPHRTTSIGNTEANPQKYLVDSQPPLPHRDPIARPISTSSRVSQMTIGDTLLARAVRSQPPSSSSNPMPLYQSADNPDRSSGSMQPSLNSTSRNSTVSGYTSSTTVRSNRSSQSRSGHSGSLHRQKYGVTKEQLEALAALTGTAPRQDGSMPPESVTFLEAQQNSLDENVRRASETPQSVAQLAVIQQRSRSKSGSRPTSHVSSRNSVPHARSTSNPSSIIYSENPDKRGLVDPSVESARLLRERQKLVRWKSEREKAEFEGNERARIKERVRRANELEEKKEKELMKKEQKKGRWSCGWFGN